MYDRAVQMQNNTILRSLTANELVSFSEWSRVQLLGAQLQDLWTDGKLITLQFYKGREIYLVISMAPPAPLIWLQEQKPPIRKSPKPATLFLAAHGRNLFLQEWIVQLEKGRSLALQLANKEQICEVEIDLIPKSPQFLVKASGKQVGWNKSKKLPPAQLPPFEAVHRDWSGWSQRIQELFFKSASLGAKSEKASVERVIEKKRKALDVLNEQVKSDEAARWKSLGEALKWGSTPPEEFRDLYRADLSVAENREGAFQKSKELIRKRAGTLERIELLKKEIEKLEQGPTESQPTPSVAAQVMKKGEASGRKILLPAGFEAVIGKSASDNLAILRRARAWDLWIHLKDEPSAHAILFREKNKEVPESVIESVAEWVLTQSSRKKDFLGGKYQVLAVECRFVKPIKGDKLGRVTYQNPRVYTFASKTRS